MKAFIISNNISFAQKIVNILNDLKLNVNINILPYISNNKIILSKIKKVDVIFIDRKVIKYFNKEFLEKYKNNVIISFIKEPSKNILIKIKILMKKLKIEDKKERIIKELKYLGYNFKYVGCHYLVDTILIMHEYQNNSRNSLEGFIYPIISKRYNKSIQNIKNNIINATDHMYYDCNIERLKTYFCFYEDIKPSVKCVIFTILNKIK